ncbi:MAG TPA: hypothetical protein VF691_11710, partial [Cytophagaceae bacterium]
MSFSDNHNSEEPLKERLQSYSRPVPEHLWTKINAEISAEVKRPTSLIWLYLLLPLLFVTGYFVGRYTTKTETSVHEQQYIAYPIKDSSAIPRHRRPFFVNNRQSNNAAEASNVDKNRKMQASDRALLEELTAMNSRMDRLENELSKQKKLNANILNSIKYTAPSSRN